MGKRRMFLAEILKSDNFYSLPSPAQSLYIYLNLEADDDGLVGNPRSIARYLKVKYANLQILINAGYLIEFENGVVAIVHWNLHNKIRRDRYTPTRFYEEKARLKIYGGIYFESDESQAGQGIPDFFDNQNATQGNEIEVNSNQFNESEFIYSQGSRKEDSETFSTQSCGKLCDGVTEEEYEDADIKDLTYRKLLSSDQLRFYIKYLEKVKKYFEEKSSALEYDRFVTYNENRGWIGKDGEDVLMRFEKYADEWLENKKRFFADKK